jgi:hypothetical protein
MNKGWPWILVMAALAVGLIAAVAWVPVRFSAVKPADFLSALGTLLVFALLIERTVEVFMTIWRAEDSYKKEAEVKRLIDSGDPTKGEDLKEAREALIEYKAQTQRWALPCTFILGLLLASCGVRVLHQFLVIPAAGGMDAPPEWQHICLQATDVVLTAALLSGGADPIHKLMDAFRKFMEATSAKADGTSKK